MEREVRARTTAILIALSLVIPTSAYAATKKPTPAASTKKPVVTKKPVKRKIVRKRVKPVPSPSPKWPPINFYNDGEIYLKVALTGKELTGALAAAGKSSQVYKDSQKCATQVCGVIQVASESSCYWEVDSVLYGPSTEDPAKSVIKGNLRTFAERVPPKKVTTIFLITPEVIADNFRVSPVTAKCWTSTPPETIPSNSYTPIG